MKRFAFASLVVLLSSCSETPTVIPARNLERPSDMGFLCLATQRDTSGNEFLTGQPMRVCQPVGACAQATPENKCPDLATTPRTLGTFAVVTNTSRGELAVVDLDRGRLVDLDPTVPGFGMVPVGALPESLAASQDGCWVATANRDSCDLALIDPSRLLSPLFNNVTPASGTGAVVSRIRPTTASGRVLQAAPREIAFLPSADPAQLCSATRAPMALVTFPSCNLVALLDLPSGRVVDSYYVQASGAVRAGAEPVCANDCLTGGAGDETATSGSVDASLGDAGTDAEVATDGGGVSGEAGVNDAGTSSPLGVGALAVTPDGTRVFVGSSQLPSIAVFDVAGSTLIDRGRLTLAAGALGVDRLRLTVDPFRPRIENGVEVGQGDFFANTRGRFLYAFAHDASVRVIQLNPALANGIGQECDVNIEHTDANKTVLLQTLGTAGLTNNDPFTGPCIPVGTPGVTRNPLIPSPGITIPVFSSEDREPPLPRDIAFAEVDAPADQWLAKPQGLTGQFGFLLASNGAVYVTNLAPNPEPEILLANQPADPARFMVEFVRSTATHAFREARVANYAGAKQPSAYVTPLRVQNATDVLFPTTAALSPTVGPRLDSFRIETDKNTGIAATTTNNAENVWATFPDPTSLVSPHWSIVWEDLLPGTSRDTGTVVASPLDPTTQVRPTAGTLIDAGGDFCSHSVLAGDLAVLPGCLNDTDCVPQEEFVCRRVPGGVRGLCLPKDDRVGKPLVDQCTRFLNSRRRYEIQKAEPTRLTLGLKLDEVPRPSTSPCTTADQKTVCQPPGFSPSAAKFPDGSSDPGFECLPVNGQNRCVKRCPVPGKREGDVFCRLGYVCEDVPGVGPRCVEAPPIDTACWAQPSVTYNVHAGRSYVVTGSELPKVPTTKVVGGQCAPDTSVPPDRIPLSAPTCTNIPNNTSTQSALSTTLPPAPPVAPAPPTPNPCLFQVNAVENNAPVTHTNAAFQNTQIRFVMTGLDQYPGDGLTIRLDVADGVAPDAVIIPSYDIMVSQGVRIVLGPTRTPESPFRQSNFTPVAGQDPQYPFLYVVDQGRTVLSPARGQILRINPRRSSDAFAAFSPAMTGDEPFQIQ